MNGGAAMNLKARKYVEAQKSQIQARLDARRELLKGRGLKEEEISKEVTMRKLKADLRKSNLRLASITAQEKQNQALAQLKADKAAGLLPVKEKKQEEAPKKEKKAKKEKTEKPPKGEGKEGKKEKAKKSAEPQEAVEA
jgi:hypothetical protein